MGNVIDQFIKKCARKAIVMEIGGFRPSGSPAASWFGCVNLAAPGEIWPIYDGQPMHALAQINLTELPFHPPRLDDIDFITIFICSDGLPAPRDLNGSSWVLRDYKDITGLVPLEKPVTNSSIEPFQMRPRVVENDFPCIEDIPGEFFVPLWEAYLAEQFLNLDGFKLGGWPTLIQTRIDWPSPRRYSIDADYVFQIDSTEKGNWGWGDSGVGYFGRGTAEGYQDHWVLEWQCY